MPRRLRQKAWQNVGLDPDVLWPEKAQIIVGAAPQIPAPVEEMATGSGDNVIYKAGPMEPADADNAATPRPRTLDAFHGLVKAAQADAEASASSQPPLVVAGDAKPAELRKPKTQNGVKSTESYFAYDPSQKLDEHAQQPRSNPGLNMPGHQHHTSTMGPPKALLTQLSLISLTAMCILQGTATSRRRQQLHMLLFPPHTVYYNLA